MISLHSLGLDELSVDDRLRLAEQLWDSIAADPANVPLSPEQLVDLESRLEEFHDRPLEGSTWEEVKLRLSSGE